MSKRRHPRANQLLRCVAAILEAPRDRYGRLCLSDTESARNAREEMREYAVLLGVGGAQDTPEQCAKVIRTWLLEEGA